MPRHNSQGQGHPKNASSGKNGQLNKNIIDKNDQSQGSSVTDILGLSRDVLYGDNVSAVATNATDRPQHQPPAYGQQNQLYMPGISNVQTTQTQNTGQPTMYFTNADQYNGQTNQAFTFTNQSVPFTRQGSPNAVQTANGPVADSNIPPWASSLCQQIGSIQTMLDGHVKRWQVMEHNVVTQNEKLNNMGKQLSEISSLKRELINTNAKVYDVENEMRILQTQVTEYDDTIHKYSDMYDNITTNNSETGTEMKNMGSRIQSLEDKIGNMDKILQETNVKLTDVRWRTMRENLLFFGIRESDQPGEDLN